MKSRRYANRKTEMENDIRADVNSSFLAPNHHLQCSGPV